LKEKWERWKIEWWVFIPEKDATTYSNALEQAKSIYNTNKNRPLHYWHKIWNQIKGDKIVWKQKWFYIPEVKLKPRVKNIIQQNRLANQIAKIVKDPKLNDLVKLLNKHWTEAIKQGIKFAEKKNMIKKEEAQQFKTAVSKKLKENNKAPIWKLTTKQKQDILDMLGWQSIFKKSKDFKINIPQLAESLKNIMARLHIVNAPEGSRVKLPFSLMWNKSATFRQVLLPMIKKAINKWAEIYVEPFGWAGTVYYFAPEMIDSWIKEMHINHFDDEKYETIKYIKENKVDIPKFVDKAYNKIVDEIWQELSNIPEIKEIIDNYNIQIWDPEFKELMELSFYPQYAKQYFEERPDTKLAIKWNLTESFKSWLAEHLQDKAKEEWKVLEWKELKQAVKLILNDSSLFEKQYPQISKKIWEILSKYDEKQIKHWDIDWAMLKTIAKHFRQRWDSWQKIVSASNWFQDITNIRKKVIDWLTKYKQTFNEYWNKIHIYNMDWKEFITKMWKSDWLWLNNKKTISYLDPPYVRTTETYIKQNPELKSSLEEYADTSKIHQLFEPMKDSVMMFTNDINWKYFEALNKMLWDRMSKDIIWYKEWTTPTSLVTTKEIAVKPRDVGLEYYTILKDSYTKDIMKSLREWILPKISKQMEKHLAKYTQHFNELMKEKFWELTKIQDEIFKWEEAYKKFEEWIKDLVFWQDKQKLLSEAKKWVKQNKVRWSELVKLIDKINKLWVEKWKLVKDIKVTKNKIDRSESIDNWIRSEFQEWFNENYTEKKVPQVRLKELDQIKEFEKWNYTEENIATYTKYLEDEKFAQKIQYAKKQSIYNLSIDELQKLWEDLKKWEQTGRETKKYEEYQEKQYIQKKINEIKNIEKIEDIEIDIKKPYTQMTKWEKFAYKVKKILHKMWIKTKEAIIDTMPSLHVIEKLWIHRQIYDMYKKNFRDWHYNYNYIMKEYFHLKKELKLNEDNLEKIWLYWLIKRWDDTWKAKILAYIKKKWIDPVTKQKIYSDRQAVEVLEKIQEDNFLNEMEKEMYEFMRKNLDNVWDLIFWTAEKYKTNLVKRVDNYFPIKLDSDLNNDLKIDPLIWEVLNNNFRRANIKAWFLEKATKKMIAPVLNAETVFLQHIYRWSYYWYMQDNLAKMNKFINTLWEKRLWNIWYKYMKEWLDNMARQGITNTEVSWFGRVISRYTKRISKWLIAFKPSSIIVQPLAILESLIHWAKLNKVFLNLFSKKDTAFEKSNTFRNRDFEHMFERENAIKWWIDKIINLWLRPMWLIDITTYKAIWNSMYKEMKWLWFSEDTAIYYADLLSEKSLAPTMFDWKPLFMMKHERWTWTPFTVFMTFTANRFAEMMLWWWRSAVELIIARSKKPLTHKTLARAKLTKWIKAMVVITSLTLWFEQLARNKWNELIWQKQYNQTTWENILNNTIWQVPVLSSILGSTKYGWEIFIWPLKNLYSAVKSKTTDKKIENTIIWLYKTAWLPDVFTKIYKNIIKSKKVKTKTWKSKKLNDIDLNDFNDINSIDLSWLWNLDDLWNLDINDL